MASVRVGSSGCHSCRAYINSITENDHADLPSVWGSEYPSLLLPCIAEAVSPEQPGCRAQETGFSLFILAEQAGTEPVALELM